MTGIPEVQVRKHKVKKALIQGGMGVGISLSGLASAVANEGGIGVIAAAAIAFNEPDFRSNYTEASIRALRKEIRKARKLTKGKIGINVMVALSNYADMVKTGIDEGIDFIIAGAGLPLDLPELAGDNSHTALIPIVSSGRVARLIMKSWWRHHDERLPDAFVVEGPMAGGHIGFKPSEEYPDPKDNPEYALDKLVVEVLGAIDSFCDEYGIDRNSINIPVFAAGGIWSGEDISRIMRAGASGVQMGTRFVTTKECDANERFPQTYIDTKEEDIVLTLSPVGMYGRVVRNEFVDKINDPEVKTSPDVCPVHCVKTCKQDKGPYCIFSVLISAQKGKFKHGFAFAGVNAWRATEIISVHELMMTLEREYEEAEAEAEGKAQAMG
ncbi:MAG: nitronate monooxygenase family protein [bacterium]|nr:nitronate monooxygenase family protein [bacterium]